MDVGNIRWTRQTLSDHFSDGTTIDVSFAGRLDPLCAEFLALDVVEIVAFVLHPQPTLDGPEVFQQSLRDNGSNRSVKDRVEDLDVWQDRLGIFMLTRVAGTFFLSSYIGDAGNTSLVDAGTPLGATAVVTPGSAGYLLWECCILASL